jgi:GNAT superfamily N-acetyltransferase
MEVRVVDWRVVLPLRWQVLRPGRPVESAYFPGDKAPTTLHLAAYIGKEVVGVASFYEEAFPWADIGGYAYRLRGMATAPAYQRKAGIGTQILQTAWPLLQAQGVEVVWCYARLEAVPFYAKNNFRHYEPAGIIEIPDVGPHEVWYYPLAKGADKRGV